MQENYQNISGGQQNAFGNGYLRSEGFVAVNATGRKVRDVQGNLVATCVSSEWAKKLADALNRDAIRNRTENQPSDLHNAHQSGYGQFGD